MARIPRIPPVPVQIALRGKIQYTVDRGIAVAKKWPRKRRGKPTPAQADTRAMFTRWVADLKTIAPIEIQAAKILAEKSSYVWRDVISRASTGRILIPEYYGDHVLPDFNVQAMLSQLGGDSGAIIVNTDLGWFAVPRGPDGWVLAIDTATHLPVWVEPTTIGINQLTGDVTAGPGTGTQAATLANTAVTPGTYTNTDLTVDSKGRITAAASGASAGGINQLTGDVTAGPGTGSQAATLADTAVTPGTYTKATLTVDSKGRLTAASNGSASGLAYIQSTPANPATTNSTAGVMCGFAISFTPASSGVVEITITVSGNNNVNGRGGFIIPRYGTGTAPTNGAAATGTAVGAGSFTNAMATNTTWALAATGIATGLTPGTTYWIDAQYGAITGGITTWFNFTVTAKEI